MDATNIRWLLFAGCISIVVFSTLCTYMITPKRTYYPLLRLIFAITAAIYASSAVGLWFGTVPNPIVRLFTVGLGVVVAVVSANFITRRNRLPQWVSMDWRGAVDGDIRADELDHAVLTTRSIIRHGSASPELIEGLRRDIDDWERHKRWTAVDLPRMAAERRTARQRANAAQDVAATEAEAARVQAQDEAARMEED